MLCPTCLPSNPASLPDTNGHMPHKLMPTRLQKDPCETYASGLEGRVCGSVCVCVVGTIVGCKCQTCMTCVLQLLSILQPKVGHAKPCMYPDVHSMAGPCFLEFTDLDQEPPRQVVSPCRSAPWVSCVWLEMVVVKICMHRHEPIVVFFCSQMHWLPKRHEAIVPTKSCKS